MASSMALAILLSAKDAASSVIKGVETSAAGLGSTIMKHHTAIGAGMTAMGGAIVAGGLMSVKSFAEMGDEVQKMSLRTSWAAESLSELRHVADISGTSLEGFEKGTRTLSKAIVGAQEGLTTYSRSFERMGLDFNQLAGLKPEEQFWKVAAALNNMEDETARSATALELFGRTGTQLFPMFAEGAEGIADLRQEAHDLGIVFDQDAANAAARMTDNMSRMESSLNGVKMAIASNLIPALTPLIEKITEIIQGISAWMKEHPELARTIVVAAAAIGGLLVVLGPLVLLLPTISAALPLIAGGFSLLLGPVGLVAAAVIALGAAFVYFKNKADDAKQAIESVDESLRNSVGFEYWPKGMNEAEKATIRAKNATDALMESTQRDIASAIRAIPEGWEETEFAVKQATAAYEGLEDILNTTAYQAEQQKQKFMELSFVYPELSKGALDWADSEKLALDMQNEVTGQLKESLAERVADLKQALAKRVADTKRAIYDLRRSWDEFFRQTGPIAKQWDIIGASADDAMRLMIEMSGKSKEAIRDLFVSAGFETNKFRENWAEMAKTLGIDSEAFITNLGNMLNATKSVAETAKEAVISVADEFKATGSVIVDETNKLLGYANIVKARVLEAIGYGFGGLQTSGGYAEPHPLGTPPTMPTNEDERWSLWAATIGQHQLDYDRWRSTMGFAKGGIVPGPMGSPQLIMAHGGETVTPAGRAAGITVNINGGTFLGNESEARQFANVIGKYLRNNQIAQFGTVRA